jgi:predicted O-methyltransferase YrrM
MSIPRPVHVESQNPQFFRFRRIILFTWLAWALLSLAAWMLWGSPTLIFALVALGGILLAWQTHIYHQLQIEQFHHYRQLESLLSLHSLLEFHAPLPPLRLWAVAPDFATLIVQTILHHQPRTIVELGSGTSTLIAGYSAERAGLQNTRIISLEHDALFADETRAALTRHSMEQTARIIHAPLTTLSLAGVDWHWYDLTDFPEIEVIDLLIVDGPPDLAQKMARYPALPVMFDKLADGALILVDDFMRQAEHTMVNRWLDEFQLEVIETISNEKGAAILRKVVTRPK